MLEKSKEQKIEPVTIKSVLEKIIYKDEIEEFLYDFSTLRFPFEELLPTNITYINTTNDFYKMENEIYSCGVIAFTTNDLFSKIFISTLDNNNYVIDLRKIDSADVKRLLENKKVKKYAINSFKFIKWCFFNNIAIDNIYDIPTYIKILTNDVDPYKDEILYVTDYSRATFDIETPEKNNLTIAKFILKFGEYLSKYADKFELDSISRLINENALFEATKSYTFNDDTKTTVKIRYNNLRDAFDFVRNEIIEKYKEKTYFISPLKLIVPKLDNNINSLISNTYFNDLTITLLNELYRKNIPIKFDFRTYEFIIKIDKKYLSNTLDLVKTIFQEAFKTIFDLNAEIFIEMVID